MNEQQRKAMELALEALDFSTSSSPCVEELQDDAIAAIKEALAQPEQRSVSEYSEPVAWAPYLSDRADGVSGHYAIARWNPRGYREVWNLRRHAWGAYSDDVLSLEEADTLLRLIEIPTRRVESPQPAQQEPVGVFREDDDIGHVELITHQQIKLKDGDKLYTTPSQRTAAEGEDTRRAWVGLTDEEAQWLYDNCRTPSNLIDMTEAKLKDKNT